MTSLGIIDTDGQFKRISNGVDIPEGIQLSPGEKFTWREMIYFELWPNLPPVIEITFGTAKAFIKRSPLTRVPSYEIEAEGRNSSDLSSLISICFKRIGGESQVIEPEPRQHSLLLGILGDIKRFREWMKK